MGLKKLASKCLFLSFVSGAGLMAISGCRSDQKREDGSEVQEATAFGYKYDKITFTAFTSDGQPIQGATLSYMLYRTDHPSFSILDSDELGETDASGTFTKSNVKVRTLRAMRPGLLAMLGGSVLNATCANSGKKVSLIHDSMHLKNSTEPCLFGVTAATDHSKEVQLECVSDSTHDKIAQAIAGQCS